MSSQDSRLRECFTPRIGKDSGQVLAINSSFVQIVGMSTHRRHFGGRRRWKLALVQASSPH